MMPGRRTPGEIGPPKGRQSHLPPAVSTRSVSYGRIRVTPLLSHGGKAYLNSAILALEDGTVFEGKSFGAPSERSGEVVFNTALTGYQEVFTDPSYSGQIVVLTN